MKPKLLLAAMLISSLIMDAQTILWEEDFESYTNNPGLQGIDGTTVGDFNELPFTIDADETGFNDSDNDYIRIWGISEFELQMRDLDGEARVTFDEVDISSEAGMVTISFSDVDFNMRSSTNFWSENALEYIDIYYSLDGGSNFTRIPNHMGNGNADHTFVAPSTPTGSAREGMDFDYSLSETIDPGAANSIIVQIRAYNNGSNEEFEFDDLIISRGGTELYNEPFQSFINGSGMAQDFAIPTGLVGTGSEANEDTTAGVTAWSVTGTLENSDDHAAVRDFSSNGTNVFRFEDVNLEATFETEPIDITGESEITFGFDINFDDTGYESSEYLDVFYSTDGGSNFTLAQEDGTSGHTYFGPGNIASFVSNSQRDQQFSKTLSGLSSTSLIIRIVGVSNSHSEDYEIDNIKVVKGGTLGIANNTLNNVKVYPNPVRDGLLNIKLTESAEASAALFDVSGREVYKTVITNSKIDVSGLASGLYLLEVSQNNKTYTTKILK